MAGRKQHAFSYLDQGIAQGQATQQQQLAFLEQALAAITGGYGGALNQISRGERSARQGAVDRAAQTGSALQSQAIGRGLYNTSGALGQQRGVAADLERNLAAISSDFAGRRAGLQAQQGMAQAGVRSQQANLLQALQSQIAQANQFKADYRLSTRPPDGGGFGSVLGGIGGALVGGLTGPLGAGMGMSLGQSLFGGGQQNPYAVSPGSAGYRGGVGSPIIDMPFVQK